MRTLTIILIASWVAAAAATAQTGASQAGDDALELPGKETIAEHRSFDPGPELQRTPGGNLIVNAFIMDGPVRVEIRERDSDKLLLERDSDTLFSFEVSHHDLGVDPERVLVNIYVKDSLEHELVLRDGR